MERSPGAGADLLAADGAAGDTAPVADQHPEGDPPATGPGDDGDGARGAGDGPTGSSAGDGGFAETESLGSFEDEITIRVPARSIYVAVLRTAIAGVAARCDFNVDEIEDLRIAVDEACGLLLHDAAPGAMLSCHFAARADSLVAAVSSQVVTPRLPNPTSFGWLVLSSLAGAVRAELNGDVLTILLSRPRVTTTT